MIPIQWRFWKSRPKPKSIKQISAERHEQYKVLLKTIKWDSFGSEPEMMLVHTDLAGHNYYVPRQAYQGITRDRLAAVEAAAMAMEHRMSREQIMTTVSEILIRFEKCRAGADVMQSATEGYSIALDMFNVMKNAPENEILMQYALNMIMTDGEDPTTISPSIMKEKRKRAENDPALLAFFLDTAHASLSDSLPTFPQHGPMSSLEKTAKNKDLETMNKIADTEAVIRNFIKGGKPSGA